MLPVWLIACFLVYRTTRKGIKLGPIIWVVDCRTCDLHLEFAENELELAQQHRREHDEHCDGILVREGKR